MEGFVAFVSAVYGGAFSAFVELVPGVQGWWDKQSNEWKRAYRAYAGIVVVAVLAALHFLAGVDFGLGADFDVHTVIWLVLAWYSFAGTSEISYQVAGPFLPRKR